MFQDVLDNNNLSIKQCSEGTGIPKSTIADLAKGKTSIQKMSAINLYNLSQYFNVSMEQMLFYCMLPSYEDSVDLLIHEQKKIDDMGLKQYVATIKRTLLIETCDTLHDEARLAVYWEAFYKYYKERRLPIPEEYRRYMR